MSVVIRAARASELPGLLALERDAAARFAAIPGLRDLVDDTTPVGELERARREKLLWVAVPSEATDVAGFAYAARFRDSLHLEELSVATAWGRRGIGRALVEVAIECARGIGLPAVTLTTFQDVPWNAPWYRRLGFETVPVENLSKELEDAFRGEARRGLPTALRVVMRKTVETHG